MLLLFHNCFVEFASWYIYVHLWQVYRSTMARKWYAVYVGHVPGVYDEWLECQAQVSGLSSGIQKGFDSRVEAEASYLRFIAQQGIQN